MEHNDYFEVKETKEEYTARMIASILVDLGENPETFRQERPENDYMYRSLEAGYHQSYDMMVKGKQKDKEDYDRLLQSFSRCDG